MTRMNREKESGMGGVERERKKNPMRKRKLTASSHDCHKFSCKIHVHLFGMCCELLFVRFHNLRDPNVQMLSHKLELSTHTYRTHKTITAHKKSSIDENQCTPISQAVRLHE